jgi:hypothetical protein
MDKAILYIHGKGGNPKEAEYYKALFEEYDVIGFDYSSQSPWEGKNLNYPVSGSDYNTDLPAQ